jgi:glycosyltransferase involved in cell wall biosynthesis
MQRRDFEDISVLYVWVLTSRRKSLWARVGNHVSFMILALAALILERGPFDLVLSTSPPLFVGVAGWLTARLRGVPHVLDVRDLWPDIAVAMGELDKPLLIRLSRALERRLYRGANAISAVTESFCSTISAVAGESSRVELIRNGTHPAFFGSSEDPNRIRKELGMSVTAATLRIAYVGNVGLPQGLMHLVVAAQILESQGLDFELWIVGAGPMRLRLEEASREQGVASVRFRDRVDQARARDWMVAADVLVVSLANVEMLGQFVPSKLYDSIATGRPVLLGAPQGEARGILEDSGAGMSYAPEDARALALHLSILAADLELRRRLGEAGESFARSSLDRDVQAQRMVNLIEDLTGRNAKRGSSCELSQS